MFNQILLSRSATQVPDKDETTLVRDCLLRELTDQMREIQHIEWEKEREEKEQKNIADYTWLSSCQRKYYELPSLVQMELEDLCGRVRKKESGEVINRFRELLQRQPDVKEVPLVLKSVINEILQNRATEDSFLDVIRKRSFNTVRLRDKRVHPFNISEQVPPTRRAVSMPEFRTALHYNLSLPRRNVPEFCANMDDLPV